MMNKEQYSALWMLRKIKRKVLGAPIELKKYGDKAVVSCDDFEMQLFNWIESGKPFMAARFGASELNAMAKGEYKEKIFERQRQKALTQLVNCSGFFPDDIDLLEQFCEEMHQSCRSLDLLGVWSNYMEDYFVDKYCKKCTIGPLIGLEPWYAEQPWTRALKGKKVLIIHPFEKTIQKQYKVRERLFPGTEILPELGQLYTLKAVQTIAGQPDIRFENWFQALEWMYQEAMKIDFDIAIIGCGAYGFPLAARLKEAGKQAVHMGGATQLLFGIKGRRWDDHPVIGKLYNEFWVRPDESETPKGAEKVEQGCYW